MKAKKNKTSLEKLLIINDDADDIKAVMDRLPDSINAQGASQFQASCMMDKYDFDLILLDNDANDRKESKGEKTLNCIRERAPEIPVVYTSFQPGWVSQEVYQTKGVTVVKTDELLDYLTKMHGVQLKEPQAQIIKAPQVSIILSYNHIDGYDPGTYGDGKLLVISFDKRANEMAKEVAKQQLTKLYNAFDWRADRDKIRNVFIYDGLNGGTEPGRAAACLGHDARMKVNLLACTCDWDRKQKFVDSMYVDLYKVGCGGNEELGAIADVILGIKRPGRNYLPMPVEKILAEAQKFAI